jgi:hypothetical protein
MYTTTDVMMVCFRCPWVALTVSNPNLLSIGKARVNSGIRTLDSTVLAEIDVRKALVDITSQNCDKLRIYSLV